MEIFISQNNAYMTFHRNQKDLKCLHSLVFMFLFLENNKLQVADWDDFVIFNKETTARLRLGEQQCQTSCNFLFLIDFKQLKIIRFFLS